MGRCTRTASIGLRFQQLKSSREVGGEQNLEFLRAVFDEDVLGAGCAFVNPKYSIHTKRSAPKVSDFI